MNCEVCNAESKNAAETRKMKTDGLCFTCGPNRQPPKFISLSGCYSVRPDGHVNVTLMPNDYYERCNEIETIETD